MHEGLTVEAEPSNNKTDPKLLLRLIDYMNILIVLRFRAVAAYVWISKAVQVASDASDFVLLLLWASISCLGFVLLLLMFR